jgi:predicted transcriptional regulator
MKQTPCEYIVWYGLPYIRKEISERMIQKYGLSFSEAAEKLGVSVAAVSQYISGKRGKLNVSDEKIVDEIDKSAERIIQSGSKVVVSETCRLCKILITKKIFTFK